MHEDAKCTKEIRDFILGFSSAWTVANMNFHTIFTSK